MKFKTTVFNKNIGVEGQDLVVKFCFARETIPGLMENTTDWSECRDFMGDAICGMHDGNVKTIYGFAYDPLQTPLDTEQCNIGIRFPSKAVRDTFLKNSTHYLDDFLVSAGCSDLLYIVTKLVGSPDTLVLTFDKFWQQTTFNISLLTFVLKSLCWEIAADSDLFDEIQKVRKNGCETKEGRYLNHDVKQRLRKVLPHLQELTKAHKYPHGRDFEAVSTNVAHNESGFYYNCRWMFDTTVIGKWVKENAQ